MKQDRTNSKEPGLYLEDGTFFKAKSGFGNIEGRVVVVNSCNFIEVPTDTSAEGLILCFTFPQAGFAPVMLREMESLTSKACGVVISQIARTKAGIKLKEFYKKHKIALLEGVDTRELALHISDKSYVGRIYSGGDIEEASLSLENIRMPNCGKRLAVIGEMPYSLMKDLLGFGHELVQYEKVPTAFSQIDTIIVLRDVDKSEIENLVSAKIPLLALSSGAHSFAIFYGGELNQRALFSKNIVVEDLRAGRNKTVTAEFRLQKTIKKAPGRVLFLEHFTKRPVGFEINNIICLEFLPSKSLLEELLERRWTTF